MEIDYKARVLKGAALLDVKKPGWVDLIDLEELDISSGERCVTAQLSGESRWRRGMEQIGLTSGDCGTYVAHGFNAESSDSPEAYGLDSDDEGGASNAQQAAYVALNGLWRDLIAERRAAAEPAAG
ncbi:hypothetical protein ACIOHE_26490 [Streptomyces sp. NPDC087851]|uniref:hypothetical protein n=1 Tax=Streptomyces sp. NPDC087851 TaxID=3365810 RepID=UPI00381D89C0